MMVVEEVTDGGGVGFEQVSLIALSTVKLWYNEKYHYCKSIKNTQIIYGFVGS